MWLATNRCMGSFRTLTNICISKKQQETVFCEAVTDNFGASFRVRVTAFNNFSMNDNLHRFSCLVLYKSCQSLQILHHNHSQRIREHWWIVVWSASHNCKYTCSSKGHANNKNTDYLAVTSCCITTCTKTVIFHHTKYCIYPHMGQNFFLIHHLKIVGSPYICTQN